MKYFINKAFATRTAKEKTISKKSIRIGVTKNVDLSLLENKFKNLNLNSVIKTGNVNNFDEILNELYYNNNTIEEEILNRDYSNIRDIILKSIKYKQIAGIRLEAKGRLTRRYRADKSLFKLKRKGGLQNIYSTKQGLSSVMFRGYTDANLDYSIQVSKVRIGSFAVKG